MKDREATRHPGPMRVMKVDAEIAGIFVALGFLVLGAVGLPIGKWFVAGTILMGVIVALAIRLFRKDSNLSPKWPSLR